RSRSSTPAARAPPSAGGGAEPRNSGRTSGPAFAFPLPEGEGHVNPWAMTPMLLTFDIFGTVVDWRTGLGEADFDRIVDVQGELERERFRSYTEIVAESLLRVRRVDVVTAARIASELGNWPLFPDS